ncbi:S-Ena type endospore appendage [Bacillus mycoides]|uniref:S-Ena type endospore appendage n=1 Tax=Bacillus mycoides TaxID=1405 RepID=UPI002E1E5754
MHGRKNCKQQPLCIAFPPPVSCPPCPSVCNVVCNEICGNILLNDRVMNLEIWKKETIGKSTVTVAVFNSTMSNSSIKVTIIRDIGNSVEFIVPFGNTLSTTVDDGKSVIVSQEKVGSTKGKYCLEVCFAVSC